MESYCGRHWLNTQTGARIKRVKDYIHGERFMLTYGDGVSDVDINRLLDHHEAGGRYATMTQYSPAEDSEFWILITEA